MSVDERMHTDNVAYIYTIDYYSAIKKEIMPTVTTWLDLKGIMLTEMSEKGKYYMISLRCVI